MSDEPRTSRHAESIEELEELGKAIPVRKLPEFLPRQANGKRTNIATIYRWMSSNGRKGIRLPYQVIGGRRYVRVVDLLEWIDRLNRCTQPHHAPSQPPTTRQRQKQQEQARRRVEELLYRNKQ